MPFLVRENLNFNRLTQTSRFVKKTTEESEKFNEKKSILRRVIQKLSRN